MHALLLVLLLAAAPLAEQMDDYLAGQHRARKLNGVVLVARKGRVLLEKAYGVRDVKGDPLTVDCVFNLASVSKQMTAMAVMILEDRGRLRYDDDVRKYVPRLPYPGITVRQLLHHTSGLPDYFQLAEEHWDSDQTLRNADVVSLLAEHRPPLDFKPGTRQDYSNTGYALLASVVEGASGRPFADFMAAAVFKPLGMTSTFLYSPERMRPFESRRAYGLARKRGGWRLDDMGWLDGVYGDGGVCSTARDLLKWDQALYAATLVSRRTLDLAFRSGRLPDGTEFGYGFGWHVEDDGSVWHDGSWAGFRTQISRYRDTRDTVIILTNAGGEGIDDIGIELQELLGD